MKKIISMILVCCMSFTVASSISIAAPAMGATLVEYGNISGLDGWNTGAPWRLYDDGTLFVGEGFVDQDESFSSPWSWYPLLDIYKIVFTGPVIAGESMSALFANLPYLTAICGLDFIDTSNVTDIHWLFNWSLGITKLDLSSWDVSNVTDMSVVFSNNASLANLDISDWDTSSVVDMRAMFHRTHSLTHLDLSHFNTSNVRNMESMFAVSNYLIELDLSNWDTSNVTTMQSMFSNVSGLPYLDVSHFDTQNVTDMTAMFNGMFSLTSLDLSEWDTSNVRRMWIMFSHAFNLTSLNLSGWDTRNVTTMDNMFQGTTALRELTLGEHFKFVEAWCDRNNIYENAALPPAPNNYYFTGYWQNVGNGTVYNPQGEFVFTSDELMRYYDGSIHAGTWVWQPRRNVVDNDIINNTINVIITYFDINPDNIENIREFLARFLLR